MNNRVHILPVSLSRLLNLLFMLLACLVLLNYQFIDSVNRLIRQTTPLHSLCLLEWLVALSLFAYPQFLAGIILCISASSSCKRSCLFLLRSLCSVIVIFMLTFIMLLLTSFMTLYLLLRI